MVVCREIPGGDSNQDRNLKKINYWKRRDESMDSGKKSKEGGSTKKGKVYVV